MLRTTKLYGLGLTVLLTIGLADGLIAHAADSTEQRARIVESSLKDLSRANDAALTRQRIEPGRELDPFGNPRVALLPTPAADIESVVGANVESNLHRLRRETVSRHTEDGRKARVEERLDRAVREQR